MCVFVCSIANDRNDEKKIQTHNYAQEMMMRKAVVRKIVGAKSRKAEESERDRRLRGWRENEWQWQT